MSSSVLLAERLSFRIMRGIDYRTFLTESHLVIPLWNDIYPTVNMYHISCCGHTMVILNCGSVICFAIMGFWFNLLQQGKYHAIHLLLQVEVRLVKNIVPLSYKVRTQTQIGVVDSPSTSLPQRLQWDVAWYNSAPWRTHCRQSRCLWT